MIIRRFMCSTGACVGDVDAEIRALAITAKADFIAIAAAIVSMNSTLAFVGHVVSHALPMAPPAQLWRYDTGGTWLWFSVIRSSGTGTPLELRLLSVTFSRKPTPTELAMCVARHNAGTLAFK